MASGRSRSESTERVLRYRKARGLLRVEVEVPSAGDATAVRQFARIARERALVAGVSAGAAADGQAATRLDVDEGDDVGVSGDNAVPDLIAALPVEDRMLVTAFASALRSAQSGSARLKRRAFLAVANFKDVVDRELATRSIVCGERGNADGGDS